MEYTWIYCAFTVLLFKTGSTIQNSCDLVTNCDWKVIKGFEIYKPGNDLSTVCGTDCSHVLPSRGKSLSVSL